MEVKKKSINWFKVILLCFLIIYVSLYVLNAAGYYGGSSRSKVEFTKEQIEKFEEDVSNGEKVDLNDYLVNQTKDYSNSASKIGYNVSQTMEKVFNKGLKGITSLIAKLFS